MSILVNQMETRTCPDCKERFVIPSSSDRVICYSCYVKANNISAHAAFQEVRIKEQSQ